MKFKKICSISNYQSTVLIGWTSRMVGTVFTLISVRILIDLIGVTGFAVYSILTSIGSWVILLNFGMHHAIQNIVAKYRVTNKTRDDVYANLIFLIVAITILAIPIVGLASLIVSKYFMINYQHQIAYYGIFSVLYLFALSGLSQIFFNIMLAEHNSLLPNIYSSITMLLSTLSLVILKLFNIRNSNVVIAIYYVSYLVLFLVAIYKSTGFIRPKFNKELSIDIFNSTKYFCVFAVFASCTLSIDYMIMSRLLPAIEITKYNLVMKFYNMVIVLYYTLLSNSWATLAESYHIKNTKIIVKLIIKNCKVGMGLLISVSFVIFIFNYKLFSFLSGKSNLHIMYSTLLLATIYTFLRIWTDIFTTILSSMNKVRLMTFIVPVQAIVSVIFQVICAEHFGINGILLGLILSFILTVAVLLPIIVGKELKVINA